MSLWDDAVKVLHATYADANSAYEDLRNFLPGSLFVDGIPVPLKSTLDAAYGTPAQRRSVIEAYMVLFGGARVTSPASGATVASWVSPSLGADMTTLVIPNAFQVTIEGVCSGQTVDNVIGVTNSSGTAAGAAAAVKTVWEAVGGPLKLMTNLLQIQNYHAVDLSSTSGSIADVASTTLGGNTTTPTISTMAACALVQWNGSSRSRSTRGRLYLGPVTEGNINSDGRTLASASVTAYLAAFNQVITQLNAANYPLAVLSRTLSTAYPVTSAAVESVVATQRRRLR